MKTVWSDTDKAYWQKVFLNSHVIKGWADQIKAGANTINKGDWLDGGLPYIAEMYMVAEEVLNSKESK